MPRDHHGVVARAAFAHDLAVEAGTLAREFFDRVEPLTTSWKGPQDLVSEADLAVERLIKERIGQAYPGDGFLGEETGLTEVDDAEGTWVVDPIDGTQSFVNDLPTWSVSIAYLREAQPVLGAVYAPVAGECFIGGRGVPATSTAASSR